MQSHDAEKLDVEVKLKVEHLTLVTWDRSVATRLKPHESSAASQTKFLASIGREVAPVLQLEPAGSLGAFSRASFLKIGSI